jgi:hypothetical protein
MVKVILSKNVFVDDYLRPTFIFNFMTTLTGTFSSILLLGATLMAISVTDLVALCVVLFAIGVYYFNIYCPAKKAVKRRKEAVRNRSLHHHHSTLLVKKRSQSGLKAKVLRSLGYWNRISTHLWHAVQYFSVRSSPANKVCIFLTLPRHFSSFNPLTLTVTLEH